MKTKLLMVCVAIAMLFFMAGYMTSVCIQNTRLHDLTQEQMRDMATDAAQRAKKAAQRAEDAAKRAATETNSQEPQEPQDSDFILPNGSAPNDAN